MSAPIVENNASVLDTLTRGQAAAANARADSLVALLRRNGEIRMDATSFRNRRARGWSDDQYWQAAEIVHERGAGEIVHVVGVGVVVRRVGGAA
jgi:hypothetical protein